VCCAVADALGFPAERLHAFLDLVAVATIADLAPLTGENRALVRWGLKILPQTPNPGLRALLRTTALLDRGDVSASQVGYVLAPRINAVGRMGQALRGVRLLLTDDPAEAEAIANELEAENRWRQSVDGQTLKEAMASLERTFDPERDYGLVLAQEGWHPGVIGIVASRVVERVHRPTMLVALAGGEEAKGSARSIPGFHLYEAVRACGEHLTRFGGHRMAAGCSIRPERVDAFRDAFNAHAHAMLRPEHLVPEVRIDLEVELRHADQSLARMLRHAGPFGAGNATPVFAARRVGVVGYPQVVGQNHLKLTLGAHGSTMDAIGFGMGERSKEPWVAGGPLDVAFKLEEHHWRGHASLQARLVDVRPAE
jgi:single-stranded-DNA-specific exonuclease